MQPDLLFQPLPPSDPLRRILVNIARLGACVMIGTTGAMLWHTVPSILRFLALEAPETSPATTLVLIPGFVLAAVLFLFRHQIATRILDHRPGD